MVTFYLSLGMFVATSVAIGIVLFTANSRYNLIPVILGLAGACALILVYLLFAALPWRTRIGHLLVAFGAGLNWRAS